VLSIQHALSIQPTHNPRYYADTGLVHLLFYTAQRCRDGHLRRRAVSALRRAGMVGLRDSQSCRSTAEIGEWLIEREEEELPEGVVGSVEDGNVGFVEERKRFKVLNVDIKREEKRTRISASRKGENGIEEEAEGIISFCPYFAFFF
jgi:hypothetical protein